MGNAISLYDAVQTFQAPIRVKFWEEYGTDDRDVALGLAKLFRAQHIAFVPDFTRRVRAEEEARIARTANDPAFKIARHFQITMGNFFQHSSRLLARRYQQDPGTRRRLG